MEAGRVNRPALEGGKLEAIMGEELTQEQREALARFKDRQGRYWKSRLIALWAAGRDDQAPDGALLRQVRNSLGLDGLARVKI